MLYIWSLDLLGVQERKVWGSLWICTGAEKLLPSLQPSLHHVQEGESCSCSCQHEPQHCPPSLLNGSAAMWTLGMDFPQFYSMPVKIAF